jgi:hypothetical protein
VVHALHGIISCANYPVTYQMSATAAAYDLHFLISWMNIGYTKSAQAKKLTPTR